MQRKSILVVLVVLVAAPSLAAAFAPPPADETALLAKADPALVAALAEGRSVDVIVTGQPIQAAPAATRAEALASLDARSAPFFRFVDAALRHEGGELLGTWSAAPAAKVRAEPAALGALAALPEVRGLALDRPDAVRLVQGDAGAGDPDASNTGGRRMIQTEDLWALGFQGAGTRVSVIGTGIDPVHEAFRHADGSTRVVGWADFVAGSPTPYDDQGQGTFIGASAAGSSWYVDPVFGAFQETGVAPAAGIMAAKFLSGGGTGSFQGALDSLQWSFAHGADVTLNGWGAACTSAMMSVLQMVRTTTDAGMVNVFIAGAGGPGSGTVSGPACSEAALSVGGIDASGAVYSPSGRGPCSDIELPSPPRVCPDLVAKAANVRSAASRGTCPSCDPSGYRTMSTISAAAAFVAGGVLLIEEAKRAYTGVGWNSTLREEEEVLKLTARDLGAPGPDDTYGWGLPQLMDVHALLSQPPEAVLRTTFQAPAPVLREGASGPLVFRVRNLGAAVATGTFEATLARPDGSTVVLDSRTVAIGLLESASFDGAFVVDGAALPGTYAFRGRFDHAWTNGSTGEVVTGSITREAFFEVRRVRVEVEREGLEPTAAVGVPQDVRVTVRNVGNDAASRVVVRFTAPDHYVFANVRGLDAAAPDSRYATPAPDSVVADRAFGRVTLTFDVGDLAAGDEWSFSTTLAATRPGNHRFLLVVAYCDPAGICGTSGGIHPQAATLPSP